MICICNRNEKCITFKNDKNTSIKNPDTFTDLRYISDKMCEKDALRKEQCDDGIIQKDQMTKLQLHNTTLHVLWNFKGNNAR